MHKVFREMLEQAVYVSQVLCGHPPKNRWRMPITTPADRLAKALAADDFLQTVCDYGPQVYELPFKQSAIEKYLIVWPHLRRGFVTRGTLARVVQTSIRIAHDNALLRKYVGIEVVPVLGKNLAGEGRIVRAWVIREAVQAALALPASDFTGKSVPGCSGWYAAPSAGFSLGWYRNPAKIRP